MADIPRQELLIKLMGMTGSSSDNECLMAIRRANALLKESGWTWEALILSKIKIIEDPFRNLADPRAGRREETPPPPPPAPTHRPSRPPPPNTNDPWSFTDGNINKPQPQPQPRPRPAPPPPRKPTPRGKYRPGINEL